MKKKVKKTSKKKSTKVHHSKEFKEMKVEQTLVENFVALQSVLADMTLKLDSLTKEISNLLKLFETSAKRLAKKDLNLEKETQHTKHISDKLDNLFEQNKVIARGLTSLHEAPQSAPQMPGPGPEGYQESVSAKSKFPPLPK